MAVQTTQHNINVDVFLRVMNPLKRKLLYAMQDLDLTMLRTRTPKFHEETKTALHEFSEEYIALYTFHKSKNISDNIRQRVQLSKDEKKSHPIDKSKLKVNEKKLTDLESKHIRELMTFVDIVNDYLENCDYDDLSLTMIKDHLNAFCAK
jgi:hypothetical protein